MTSIEVIGGAVRYRRELADSANNGAKGILLTELTEERDNKITFDCQSLADG